MRRFSIIIPTIVIAYKALSSKHILQIYFYANLYHRIFFDNLFGRLNMAVRTFRKMPKDEIKNEQCIDFPFGSLQFMFGVILNDPTKVYIYGTQYPLLDT